MMLNFKLVKESAKTIAGKHGSEILSGFGIAFMAMAVVSMYQNADDIRAAACKKRQEGGTKIQVFAAGASKAGKVIFYSAASAACIVGAQKINVAKIAASTAIANAALENSALTEKKLRELVGEEKTKEVVQEVAKETASDIQAEDRTDVNTGHGNSLCVDTYSGIKFRANKNWVEKQLNTANMCMRNENYISAVEWYTKYLEIPRRFIPECLEDYGWNINQTGEIELFLDGGDLDENTGEPTVRITVWNKPILNYQWIGR